MQAKLKVSLIYNSRYIKHLFNESELTKYFLQRFLEIVGQKFNDRKFKMVTQVQRYFITSQCQHIFIIFMNHACREIMIYGVLPTTYKRSFSILWNMRLEIKNAFRTSRTGGSNLLGILVFYDVAKYNVIGQACL